MRKTLKYIAVCFALFFTLVLSTACGGNALAGIALKCNLTELGTAYYSASVGQTFTVSVETAPENFDLTDKLIWQSSDTNVATVDNGSVTTKSTGKVFITAKYKDNENINASIQLRVFAESSAELAFTQEYYTVIYGDNFEVDILQDYEDVVFEFAGRLEDGTEYPAEMKNVQPKEAGIYTVTTTYGDYKADASIIISKKDVEIPIDSYKKVYGSDSITTLAGDITDDFSKVGNDYTVALPNGDNDVIVYNLKCVAVDTVTPANTTYQNVGSYPIQLEVDLDASPKFANNYRLKETANGTLTIEPLAVTLVAKDKTVTYGSNSSFITNANYSLYRTAEFVLADPGDLSDLTDLASPNYGNTFTKQISFATTVYKDGQKYEGKFNVGEYDLNCKGSQVIAQNSKKNLTMTSADIYNAKYTITPKKLTIYPTANQSKFAGEADPELSYATNSNGIVEGDVLLPFLTRAGADLNQNNPGEYSYDIITYGDPDNFVVNDNYEIELDPTNKFTIKQNSVYFALKGQIIDYGQNADDFEYTLSINGKTIENPTIDQNGWITLQTYTYNEGEADEVTYNNKIKLAIAEDPTPEVDAEGYFKRHRLMLTYEFNENNEGWKAADSTDEFFEVKYNDVSPAFVCYNKIDLVVKPKANPLLLTKIYDNTVASDAVIYEADCVGLLEGDEDVFTSIRFKKLDTSTTVGQYPLELWDYTLSTDKLYYNVIFSDEIVYYTITQRELVVSPTKDQTKIYGSADKEFTYTITNLATGDTKEDIVRSITLGRESGEAVGEYSYVLTEFTCDPNYTYTFNDKLEDGVNENTFVITQRRLLISAVSQTIIYGDNIPELTYVVSVADSTEDVFIPSYMPVIAGAVETEAVKYSPVQDYKITKGTLDAGSNFIIEFTEGKLSVLKKSATFTVIAGEIESGVTPDVSNIQYKFDGLITGTSPELGLTIKPDNETTPTKYALSGEVYGKNNVSSALTFNYLTYNSLKLMFNGVDVVSCYDITIETTVVFYVSSLVINVSVVSVDDLTASIVEKTYTGSEMTGLFTIVIDDDKYAYTPTNPMAGYSFTYERPGSTEVVLLPVNAGTYTVKVDLTTIKITNIETGEVVSPTLNISSYGSLIINKANLYYKTDADKPAIRPMEYGSETLPTELVGRQINTDPVEYDSVQIFTDPECTELFTKGVKATYNTNVYTTAYIKSLTVLGSPYVVAMTITPREESDQANYNSVSINLDLTITPRQMDVSGASFTYSQGIKSATYTNKVINNPLKMTTDESYLDKIGVSYSFVGVNYNSTVAAYYGLIAYYESEIYVGDSANVKYISRTDLEGATFTFDPTDNYILASKGVNDYYLQLTHLSGVPINAGIYFVVANIRSTNANYALSTTSETQYKTLFEINRSEDFELNNWNSEYMYGISITEILDKFTFTTNPSRVKAYCTITYELGADVVCVEGTDIIAICDIDQSYKVKVIVSTPNYYQEKDMSFRIIQLDAVIGFPAADRYQYTGNAVTSFIQNTKVTLYALDGSTTTVVYDFFSVEGPYGVAPMQVEYFYGLDNDGDGVPEAIGEKLEGDPVDVGFYYISCIYNDRTYYGEGGAFFEITKTYYTGAISFENASFAYDPFISLETDAGLGKLGLYDWIWENMVKIPADEESKVNYKKYSYAIGDSKPIQISVVLQNGEELQVSGVNGIKNCGTYRIKLILSFNDHITQTTTSDAVLTINKVSLSTDAFVAPQNNSYVYSGSNKYNEIKYSGATIDPLAISVVGYETFNSAAGDVTGWYGYFNKDNSNFCVVYNYEKWNGSAWVKLAEKRAPIVPGRYRSSFAVIPGNNYLLQNTAITPTEFTVVNTDFNQSDSTPLTTVYSGGDQSTNSDLKLTIKNSVSAEMVITYVYYYEGKYYSYAGGEISIDPATYDETKGLIFEKYFYKYSSYGATVGERVLDTSKKLIKDDIKNAGHYQVYYKLLYPNASNYTEFFLTNLTTKFANPEANELSKTVYIEKANFASGISNLLSSNELNISFYDSLNIKQNYNYNPTLADGTEIASFSSVSDPIVSVTYGKVSIKIEGDERANLTLSVHNESDATEVPFTRTGDTYTSNANMEVGNYYFILYHAHEGVENYYESVRVYFKIVKAKVELNAITDNLTSIPATEDYSLDGTSLKFNFEKEKPVITMEYNTTEDFEKPEVLYKWISSGALVNPTYRITYYYDENCASPKAGSITTFPHGSYWAHISIESEDYSVETPLLINVIIEQTQDYEIFAGTNTFVYGEYTEGKLSVTAKYNAQPLYGVAIFFKDDPTLTAEHLALMNQFISDNSEDSYELRTSNQVAYSSVGAYNTVGLFIPSIDSYLPKAFGYKYTVTKKPIDQTEIEYIELTQTFTAPVVYNSYLGSWSMQGFSISNTSTYIATMKLLGIPTPVSGNATFDYSIPFDSTLLTSYFDNNGELTWGATMSSISFTSADHNLNTYLTTLGTRFRVKIVKPSLTTVLTSISSIGYNYTGATHALDLTGLQYNFAAIKDQTNQVVNPNPLTGLNDVITKIYNGTTSEIAKFQAATLVYSKDSNYNYTVSTTAVGTYETIITFAESTCFAETEYVVNYNINKIESGMIAGLRYEYAEGQYINVLAEGFVADVWGAVPEENNGDATFYNKAKTQMLGAQLDDSCFEILVNGSWVKLEGIYGADITYQIAGSPSPVGELKVDQFTYSEDITIIITFNADAYVNGVYSPTCFIEYYEDA